MHVPPTVVDEASRLGRRYLARWSLPAATPMPGVNGSWARARDRWRCGHRQRAQPPQLRLEGTASIATSGSSARARRRPSRPARLRRRVDGRRRGDPGGGAWRARRRVPRSIRIRGAGRVTSRKEASPLHPRPDARLAAGAWRAALKAAMSMSPMAYRRLPRGAGGAGQTVHVLASPPPGGGSHGGPRRVRSFKD